MLAELVQLRIDEAKAVLGPDGGDAYAYQVDKFERGTSPQRLDEILTEVREGLVPLIARVKAAKKLEQNPALTAGGFAVQKQEKAVREIASTMGFSWDCGRMDVSLHPFCGGSHPSDVRITTRYKEDTFLDSVMGIIHETGHALYEQGRNAEQEGLPVSEALSMGIHESQSLFWERMVGQSEAFWKHCGPILREHLPQTSECSDADFYNFVNKVLVDGLIRVDADELTYPLHVCVRFEIEKGLFDGSIAVEDLPRVWNDKMEEYLGVVPPNDTLGVLQDVHWSDGSFGYFPSYTLGAMYACQVRGSPPLPPARARARELLSSVPLRCTTPVS